MKTLEQIKNEVCQKHGMQNYTEFLYTCIDIKKLDDIIKEIVYLSQKECLELASLNVDYEYTFLYSSERNVGDKVAKQIKNENNIIK